MATEKRLIEMISQSLCDHISYSCKLAENIAGDLIANGVSIPIRCKDCKHWDKDFLWCDKKSVRMMEDDFCSYGERKENER